jgi:hypothetical protein
MPGLSNLLTNLDWKPAKIDVGDKSVRSKLVAKNIINEHSASLLDHQICTSVPLIIIVYCITQSAVGLHHTYSKDPICNHPQAELSWAKYTIAGSAMCMVLTCSLQLIRIRQLMKVKENTRNLPQIRVLLVLFTMCAIWGSSKVITFWHFGGICKDAFG